MAPRAVTLSALAALAGCADDGNGLGEVREPIVGGTLSSGDPAVVAVAHHRIGCGDAPPVFCSGVLIAPRVVLTAAHCLAGLAPRGALEVSFGSTTAAPAKTLVVQSVQSYAGYDPMTGDGDVAVLLLADLAAVAAYPRPTGSIADVAAGGALRAVGFGVTSSTANDPGVKRQGTLALGAVRAASFDASPSPAMTCAADSGGPVFATIGGGEQLVGLTSRGDAACAASAVNARVDVVLAPFVDPFVSASAGAPLGWPAGLPPIDALATTACTTDADCPALMTCTEQAIGRRCGFPWLGDGSFGATCASDGDCAAPSSRCARVWPDGADACHCFAAANAPPPPGRDVAGDVTTTAPGGCGCGVHAGDSSALAMLVSLLWWRRRSVRTSR